MSESALRESALPDVAVVVLNYNGRALLPDCLYSLAQLRTPARLVVADNGSSDGSLDDVRQRFPGVETLDLGQNLGFAAGYNAAIQRVDSEWLVLLNNDATLEPDWLERLLGCARFDKFTQRFDACCAQAASEFFGIGSASFVVIAR